MIRRAAGVVSQGGRERINVAAISLKEMKPLRRDAHDLPGPLQPAQPLTVKDIIGSRWSSTASRAKLDDRVANLMRVGLEPNYMNRYRTSSPAVSAAHRPGALSLAAADYRR